MTFTRLSRFVSGFAAFVLLSVFVGSLFPHSAQAAGEVFTWKSYNQITVSGGDLKGTSTLTLNPNSGSGNTDGILNGTLLYNKGPSQGCTVDISLYIFKSDGNGSGEIWNPPPYDNEVVTAPGSPPPCYLVGVKNIDPALHQQRVSIGGTRPADPGNTTENPEDKHAIIIILAPDPQSKAPKTVTITIKKDGNTVATQTVPFTSDSAANWPPDEMPVGAQADFANIEPGVYTVCDNYVIPKCETFEKVKGKIFSETYGTQFVTPEKKMINVHVAFHTIRPCNASITVQPVTITLKTPDGKTVDQQTNSRTILPGDDEKKGDCDVDQVVGLDTSFKNMPPGTYEACTTGAECVKFTKKPDEAANITLNVETTLQPPADQKVCAAGDGIAGAFTIIVCPFTEIAAKSTQFFEKNIIIPFLTVSPLTTNNNNPIYILWQSFRNLANIGFIIFFFFIIFSQATSFGISRYGLKVMLYKTFFVVIGVNLSYFLAAFVIDAFNIFGSGLSDLVIAGIQKAGTQQLDGGTNSSNIQSIFVLGGAALGTILLVGGSVLGWLFGLIMIALIVIVVSIIILLIRQVLIIMLVILSPIAILLYMLPNTENYFEKWRKTLIQLLMMYPLIVLLFASGKVFGIILQQPGLIQTGGAISDEIAEAIRIILQFVVYILPLAFLPLVFAASGTVMSKASGFARRRLINPRGRQLAQDSSLMASEARAKLARSGIPGVSTIAGAKYRRDYTRESRRRNAQRAEQSYMAEVMGDEGRLADWRRRRASGVGGAAGSTRAAAAAASTIEATRQEEMNNELSLLKHELNRLGMSSTDFNKEFKKFIAGQISEVEGSLRDANGNLQKLNLSKRQDLVRAALNSVARDGDITTLEDARLSENINQSIVDQVIRANEGNVMEKGGWHLATNFELANGRSQAGRQAMLLARLSDTFAGSSSDDIASMKGSFVSSVRDSLSDPTTRSQLLGPNGLTRAERDQIITNIDGVLNNANIAGQAKNTQALEEIQRLLR